MKRVDLARLDVHRDDAAAAAVVGEEDVEAKATVKRYYPEGDNIRFQPANSSMQPIYVKKADFRSTMLLGQVVGVYRKVGAAATKH